MMYYGARGLIGLVIQTFRPGPMETFVRLMPEGVGFITTHIGVKTGTEQEFKDALAATEKEVAKLAGLGVDVIVMMGAPATMVRGHGSDREIARDFEAKYKVPVITASMAHADALRALGVKRFVGASYFPDELNEKVKKFFDDDGFEVLAMRGMKVRFEDAGKIHPGEIYAFAKKLFLESSGAEGIYFLGAGWYNLPAIEPLERDLGTVVVSSVPAQVWAAQKQLHIRAPVKGYGKLLEELP